MKTFPLLAAALLWNIALGAMHLLTPLLAASMGMSASQIGLLLSLPVTFQMVLILAGGALVDRVGGKTVVLAGCMMLAVAAVLFIGAFGFFIGAFGFAALLVAQMLAVLSRAIFWPALWSLASTLPGKPEQHMGFLNSAVNAGQVVGVSGGGILLVKSGYDWSYATIALLSLVSFACLRGLFVAPMPAMPEEQSLVAMLRTYRSLLKKRRLRYSLLCAYVSAMPLALTFSFYPILLLSQGYNADTAGLIVTFRAVGGILVGLLVGRWLHDPYSPAPPLLGTLAIAIPILLTTLVTNPVLDGVLMFTVGAGSTVMMILFQMALSGTSGAARGSAMALGTIGGTVANLTTPLLMGFLIDWSDIRTAFAVMGGIGLVCAVALIPLRISAMREAPHQ